MLRKDFLCILLTCCEQYLYMLFFLFFFLVKTKNVIAIDVSLISVLPRKLALPYFLFCLVAGKGSVARAVCTASRHARVAACSAAVAASTWIPRRRRPTSCCARAASSAAAAAPAPAAQSVASARPRACSVRKSGRARPAPAPRTAVGMWRAGDGLIRRR